MLASQSKFATFQCMCVPTPVPISHSPLHWVDGPGPIEALSLQRHISQHIQQGAHLLAVAASQLDGGVGWRCDTQLACTLKDGADDGIWILQLLGTGHLCP